MPSLYEKLGGQEAVATVVDQFYEKVIADPNLLPVFEAAGTDFTKLKDHQRKFVSSALGGPNKYTGKAMNLAHAGLKITDEQFNSVVGHLAATLEHLEVSDDDIANVASLLTPLRGDVVSG